MNVFNAEGLRKARLSKRVSQLDLGLKVGMSSATICRIERGARLPTTAELEALSKAVDSMSMTEVGIPVRDFSVATRLVGPTHRIKVQISLEQVKQLADQSKSQVKLGKNEGESSALVFYVPLDGLTVDIPKNNSLDEEEDATNQMRPRQR